MNIDLAAVVKSIVEQTVAETLNRIEADRARLNGRLAYPEAEAAGLLGIPRHVLRDSRLRGEIDASRIGKRVVYERDQLLKFMETNKI